METKPRILYLKKILEERTDEELSLIHILIVRIERRKTSILNLLISTLPKTIFSKWLISLKSVSYTHLDNYYSRLHIDTAKLASLLDEINRINTDDKENDSIGRVYEYFLSKFALAEGKGKGEFYTPKYCKPDCRSA